MSARPYHWMHQPNPSGRSTPYKCGNMDGIGVSNRADVTCTDCLTLMEGVGAPTPKLHTPPRMENERGLVDGVFAFYDVHERDLWNMEVVPQATGNVEITIGESLFTLSHLDRMDLVRALLHDFHYSPEIGGPGDDQD